MKYGINISRVGDLESLSQWIDCELIFRFRCDASRKHESREKSGLSSSPELAWNVKTHTKKWIIILRKKRAKIDRWVRISFYSECEKQNRREYNVKWNYHLVDEPSRRV